MGTETQKKRKCCYHNLNAKQLKTFTTVKYIFKLVTHYQIFDFAKLHKINVSERR